MGYPDFYLTSRESFIDVSIKVIESKKKAPRFLYLPAQPIRLLENYSDFSNSIARLEAAPEALNGSCVYELLPGSTDQTNKDNVFRYVTFSFN